MRLDGSCSSRRAVASATVLTASSKQNSVRSVVDWIPLILRTYCRAAASTSSSVAGGASPRRVVMFRHICAGYARFTDQPLSPCHDRHNAA